MKSFHYIFLNLKNKYFNIVKPSTYFDIKQFICHLHGISKHTLNKPTKFIYLFYKPICDDKILNQLIDNHFNELKQEITSVFISDVITKFCKKHHIDLAAMVSIGKIMDYFDNNKFEMVYGDNEIKQGLTFNQPLFYILFYFIYTHKLI